MSAVRENVLSTRELLSDQELLFYLNELDKYKSELKKLKKDMRNVDSDSLNRMYLNKVILLNKCKYYEDILSMVSENRKKNVQTSCPNYDLKVEKVSENNGTYKETKSIWEKIVDRYFEKKVNDYAQYLH